ncbi:hypothetical protein PoB_000902600 [Plakobranchus ocellatus]|uniref:Uncharacterized protein n=1 Tax=Plakobranchus ocellatus TaxID=259542 RepID=A0AAV3Y5K5_9GAST|nr:hypothetical protein PoB_000902600 [Plakobranchus ocellatus]
MGGGGDGGSCDRRRRKDGSERAGAPRVRYFPLVSAGYLGLGWEEGSQPNLALVEGKTRLRYKLAALTLAVSLCFCSKRGSQLLWTLISQDL